MIKDPQDFEIKYWAGGNDFQPLKQEPKRSIKKKLAIVLSFVGALAIFPLVLFGLSNINFNSPDEKIAIQTPIAEEDVQDILESPKQEVVEEKVVRGDSWWKIAK